MNAKEAKELTDKIRKYECSSLGIYTRIEAAARDGQSCIYTGMQFGNLNREVLTQLSKDGFIVEPGHSAGAHIIRW